MTSGFLNSKLSLCKIVVMDGRIDLYPVIELLENTIVYSCLSVHILFKLNSNFHFSPRFIPCEINSLCTMYISFFTASTTLVMFQCYQIRKWVLHSHYG